MRKSENLSKNIQDKEIELKRAKLKEDLQEDVFGSLWGRMLKREDIISNEKIAEVEVGEKRVRKRMNDSPMPSKISSWVGKAFSKFKKKRADKIESIDKGGANELVKITDNVNGDLQVFNERPEVKDVYQNIEPWFGKIEKIKRVLGWFKGYKSGSGLYKVINAELGKVGISEEQIGETQRLWNENEGKNVAVDGKFGPEMAGAISEMTGENVRMGFGSETIITDDAPIEVREAIVSFGGSSQKEGKGGESGHTTVNAYENHHHASLSPEESNSKLENSTTNDQEPDTNVGANMSVERPDFNYDVFGSAEVLIDNSETLLMAEPGIKTGVIETLKDLHFKGIVWVGRLPSNGNRPAVVMIPWVVVERSKDSDSASFDAARYHFHGTHSHMMREKIPTLKKMHSYYAKSVGKTSVGENRLTQVARATEELGIEQNVYTVYPLSAGGRGSAKPRGYDSDWMNPKVGEHFDGLHDEAQTVISSMLGGKKVQVGEIIASGHSAGGRALQNIAESGAKVDRLDYQDASYGSWARTAYREFMESNPNGIMNLFLKSGTKTDNSQTAKLEDKKGVNYIRTKVRHGDMPYKFFNYTG